MRAQLLSTLIFLLFAQTSGAAETVWRRNSSPHFEIYHESSWAPGSIAVELERLYGKLRMGVSMFAPWMTREKVSIYIYADRQSYLNGEFKPPEWSKGLAYFSKKTVIVYDTGDMTKLRAVIAHELSHLYFESYYGEKLKYPPIWLNEGLAVMMEDLSYEKDGPWSLALRYGDSGSFSSLETFFGTDPSRLDSETRIGYWYLEAFGAVSYLFRSHRRLQFMNFCSLLRGGEPLDSALWKSYRVSGPGLLEKEWDGWLVAYRSGETEKGFGFNPVQFRQFGFNNFGSTVSR